MIRIKPIFFFLVSLSVLLISCNSPENSQEENSALHSDLPNEVIIFSSDREGGEAYYRMDVGGNNLQKIEIQGMSDQALLSQPIWSKEAQKFFLSSRINDDTDIYAMNWDGNGLENLTNSDSRWETNPVPSPDGKQIAFILVDIGQEVMVMSNSGKNELNLSNYGGNNANIAWSPDSMRVYHNSNRSGTPNIYFINKDGSNLTNITQGPGLDATYSISPDGSQLAFSSDRDGAMDLFIISTDGGDPVNITQSDVVRELDPQWSPDGQYIAYRIKDENSSHTDIYVIKPDGSGKTQLTNTPNVSESSVSWSPDGQYLLYVADSDGQSDIFMMKPDGSGNKNITNHPGNDFGPRWIIVK